MKIKIDANKQYKKIFYDKNGNAKVRAWLIKNNVAYSDLAQVESIMNTVFLESCSIYVNDKIPFEKFVWVRFKYALYNFFYRKNNVMSQNELSLDEKVETGYDIPIDTAQSIESNIDVDLISSNMDRVESIIFRCKVFNDLSDSEILDYLKKCLCDISEFEFYLAKENVKEDVGLYIKGKL